MTNKVLLHRLGHGYFGGGFELTDVYPAIIVSPSCFYNILKVELYKI